ncbi:hypothetical protein BDV38DRAFT_252924 [Aspergillus pseudotamarii]|uniref:Uncharacterized protein n=1 Tax=Aspergillus pseudotamarii TaxID=132259 RepID=A0A5N6SN09_ASPPS|nr:uncharacterized protein BDV38DRAFT_252924 [Aspergillus pseudotamarii]KAE8135277.1 hypothetical protein BDV38DRAFT_252924 [Aspergillus pseudotamarii]
MKPYACTEHDQGFWTQADVNEHLRKQHTSFIKRPARLGIPDSHGHLWYCFGCESQFNDHRSYGSDKAMFDHLRRSHSDVTYSIRRRSRDEFLV